MKSNAEKFICIRNRHDKGGELNAFSMFTEKKKPRNRLLDWATGDDWNSYDNNPSIHTFHNYRNELLRT